MLFLLYEPALPLHQLVEVHLVRVKIRPIHTGELHFAANRNAAAAAHTSPVHHDWIETDEGLQLTRTGDFRARLHHHRRPDCNHLVHVRMLLQCLFQAVRHESLETRRAVIRAENQLVAIPAESFLPENERSGAEADDSDDIGSFLLEGAKLRKDRGHAQSTSDTDHFPLLAYMRRMSHRAHQSEQRRALQAHALHFPRGFS